MKKVLCFAIAGILFLGIIGLLLLPEKLPVPEYPLTQEVLSDAMAQYGLPEELYIEETEFDFEGMDSSSYTVRDPGKTANAGACFNILSHKSGEDRSIGLSLATLDAAEELTAEECQTAIRMVTTLYGGFRNDERVCDKLRKAYDFTEEFTWEQTVDGVEVQIAFYPERNRMTMALATNQSVFAKAPQN